MSDIVSAVVLCLAIPTVFCVAIPFVVMAMLAPSLDKNAPKAANFRGAMVYNGLGIVWFVWLISFWIGAQLIEMFHATQPYWVTYIARLFPLIAGSCAFGLFDDWAGCNNTKGFSGHLRALSKGRLTTGGLKFLGIGFLSLFLSISLFYHGAASIPRVIFSTCTIALMANLMNLFDLRPGRAQKMYLLNLLLAVVFIIAFGLVGVLSWWGLAATALVAVGPILATWRFDLREKGMLGDAGANSMGALLGFLMATALPTWALAIVAAILAVVNLLSERYSFSKIIAGNAFLSRLDALGRAKITNANSNNAEAVRSQQTLTSAEDVRSQQTLTAAEDVRPNEGLTAAADGNARGSNDDAQRSNRPHDVAANAHVINEKRARASSSNKARANSNSNEAHANIKNTQADQDDLREVEK